MSRPVLLDMFCCAGGAARGYQEAGFYVVGVDNKPQPRYAGDEFVQADALEFLDTQDLSRFAAIHASPPCQGYVERNKNLQTRHPKLIAATRDRLIKAGLPYVIENVSGARRHLINPVLLCGTMFALPLLRHRLFETSAYQWITRPSGCRHRGTVAHGHYAAVYGFGGKGPRHGPGKREQGPRPGAPTWDEAMGIDWMERHELSEAIPPAYTRYIGAHLITHILQEARA